MRTGNLSSTEYTPGTPYNDDPQRYLNDELAKISEAIRKLAAGHLDAVHVTPDKPRDGDIRYADGTNWNPGSGQGVYAYINGRWEFLGVGNFYLDIAKGNIPGHSSIHKFGEAPDVDAADGYLQVWDGGIVNAALKNYTYSTTADITLVSSDSASDTFNLEVQGLDANYDLVIQTVALLGQTQVSLATPLIRVFRMKNKGATPTVGNVYCYATDTATGGVPTTITNTRSIVRPTYNQTLMALYTVPAGCTAYMTRFYATLSGPARAVVDLHQERRDFGGVFQAKYTGTLSGYSGQLEVVYDVPEAISEKTDIQMMVESDTNNTAVSSGFELILVKN